MRLKGKQMSEFPKAIDLFERFRPQFEKVQLVPAGWWRERYQSTTRFALLIYRDGKEVPWCDRYSTSKIDVGEASLEFGFQFDSTSERTVHGQLKEAVSRAIELKLAGRTFRLLPASPFTGLLDRRGDAKLYGQQVVLEGEPIPGLMLLDGHGGQSGQKGSWDSFVPRNTRQGAAIQAALSYEYRQTLQARDVAREQEEARVSLESALGKL